MQVKKSLNPNNIWFICDKCGTTYGDDMEEIIPPEEIVGSIEWANTPTSYENRYDALEKARIRATHEEINEDLGSCITGDWKGSHETEKCKS